jgi:hypothetical protein
MNMLARTGGLLASTRRHPWPSIFRRTGVRFSGVANCARDRGLLETEELPAIILLDGREDIVQTNVAAMKSVKMPFAIFRLQPQAAGFSDPAATRLDATNQHGQQRPVRAGRAAAPALGAISILGGVDQRSNPDRPARLRGGQIVYQEFQQTDMPQAFGFSCKASCRLQIDFHYMWSALSGAGSVPNQHPPQPSGLNAPRAGILRAFKE